MRDVVLTKNNYISLDNTIKTYFTPKYVFLPIYENAKLLVHDNQTIYKNSIVMIKEDGTKLYSPVSGIVLGVRDMHYQSGILPSVVIENDFMENDNAINNTKKRIIDYDKSSFLKLIKDSGLTFNGVCTYEKFLNLENINLLINGVEKDPYFGNKYFLLRENISNILETVDLISDLFNYKKVIIAVKNNKNDIINGFMNELGTYLNFELRLVNSEYPNGIDEYLQKIIGLKTATILDVQEIVNIYKTLRKGRCPNNKLITITGDAIDTHCVYKVKKGSLLSEIFQNNIKFTEKSVEVYLNGALAGQKIDSLQYVVDENMDGVFVTKKKGLEEKDCINCGMCHKSCPLNLNPKYVRDHNGRVKEEYKKSCLQCGLCNYVCPSNRSLSKYMR